MRALFPTVLLLCACGRNTGTSPDGGPPIFRDGGLVADAGATIALRRCPTTGPGAMEGDVCFVVTPAETGLPASGSGATVDQYALRPPTNARGQLVLFFNGSGGSPRAGIGGASSSFYGVARAQGLHVFAVSYVSGSAVGSLCLNDDGCFEPTRASLLVGDALPGAAPALADLVPDEGAFERLAAALLVLHDSDPDGHWGDFLDRAKLPDAEAAIRWEKVIVAGHSQGGGHAALVGKRHDVARVVMLASPCDGVGASVATWLSSPAGYASSPATKFHGLWSPGDTTCPRAPDAWRALGLSAEHQHATFAACAGMASHGAPLSCASAATEWARMLGP